MSDLMSKNLQNKLRLDCRMDSKTADTDKDLLAKFVIRAENRDVVASIFGDKDPSVYGDMENDDMLDFFYEPENVLNNWSKWQFELYFGCWIAKYYRRVQVVQRARRLGCLQSYLGILYVRYDQDRR